MAWAQKKWKKYLDTVFLSANLCDISCKYQICSFIENDQFLAMYY